MAKLWNQVPFLDHLVIQNSGDFLCWKYRYVGCFDVSNFSNSQLCIDFSRVRVLHLDRLKEGTWLHSFGFLQDNFQIWFTVPGHWGSFRSDGISSRLWQPSDTWPSRSLNVHKFNKVIPSQATQSYQLQKNKEKVLLLSDNNNFPDWKLLTLKVTNIEIYQNWNLLKLWVTKIKCCQS